MVWNFKSQLRAYRYTGHHGDIFDCSFSPNGNNLATASADRTVRVWRPTVQGKHTSAKVHADMAVRCVNFSADGKDMLTAGDDKSIMVWGMPSRRFKCSLLGHSNWVRSAHFSPDSLNIVSGSDDKTIVRFFFFFFFFFF
eukprot:GSMAST32.ASY1.ANO1.324.1 assembled CDS